MKSIPYRSEKCGNFYKSLRLIVKGRYTIKIWLPLNEWVIINRKTGKAIAGSQTWYSDYRATLSDAIQTLKEIKK